MKHLTVLLFMIFGMVSYSQKHYTSTEHMVITPKFQQESHIEDIYFTITDSVIQQTNESKDSIFRTYILNEPKIEGEIQREMTLKKYGGGTFDLELIEYNINTHKTEKVLYYID